MAWGNNWSVKAEYLHVDLGSVNTNSLVVAADGRTSMFTHRADFTADVVRAAINYKFGNAPIVANY